MSISRKTISWVLIIGSLLLIIISLAADLIGFGSYPGIHWAQITGAGVGLAALIAGGWLRRTALKTKG